MSPDKKSASPAKAVKSAAKKAGEQKRKNEAATKKSVKDVPSGKAAGEKTEATSEAKAGASDAPYKANAKPTLTVEQRELLGARAEKKARSPHFRRHEWWRYKRLGGKHAPWRLPRGIHSKVRRHYGYRPPLVSIGYRGPAEVRGLHPSGFEEVLVHNVADIERLDKTTQAARVGGTVGGRKAEQIEKKADALGIRVLNRRQVD